MWISIWFHLIVCILTFQSEWTKWKHSIKSEPFGLKEQKIICVFDKGHRDIVYLDEAATSEYKIIIFWKFHQHVTHCSPSLWGRLSCDMDFHTGLLSTIQIIGAGTGCPVKLFQ